MRDVIIEIKKEVDPDYGDCLYCYINGEKSQSYVRANTEEGEIQLLKHVIAGYHFAAADAKRKYEKLEMFQNSCRQLLAMAKEVLL